MSSELPKKIEGDVEIVPFQGSIYQNSEAFEYAKRVAAMLKVSDLVPESYRKNPADIMIAIDQANRLEISPLFLMQRMSVVKGKPVLEGQLVIALINQRGGFVDPLEFIYEGDGDERQCTCVGVRKDNGRKCETTVGVKMAKDMGWWARNALWSSMTDQFLAYRSAMFFSRLHCPEIIFGMQLREEVVDMGDDKKVEHQNKITALNERLSKK